MQDAAAWPESDLQGLVAAEWRSQCQSGPRIELSAANDTDAPQSAAGGVDARGMVDQARMLKVVRVLRKLKKNPIGQSATPDSASCKNCTRLPDVVR